GASNAPHRESVAEIFRLRHQRAGVDARLHRAFHHALGRLGCLIFVALRVLVVLRELDEIVDHLLGTCLVLAGTGAVGELLDVLRSIVATNGEHDREQPGLTHPRVVARLDAREGCFDYLSGPRTSTFFRISCGSEPALIAHSAILAAPSSSAF